MSASSKFLEANLLRNLIDVTDSISHSITGRLALSVIHPKFVDRFGRFNGFATYNLMRKPFLMVSWHISVFLRREGGRLHLSDFKGQNFCGLCGTCLLKDSILTNETN